ncbi:MAG: hypothetical protein ACE5E1_10760, partial [Phycisphaerae bacterium]
MVGLVLLAMISFVGGQALYSIMGRSTTSEVVMRIFGREVEQGELMIAQRSTEALDRLLIGWRFGSSKDMSVRHWLMLAEEAERAGIAVSDREIETVVDQCDANRRRLGYGSLEKLRTQSRISRATIREAVARFLAIKKNLSRVLGAAEPSEPQIRQYVHDTADKVQVKFVQLDANQFLDPQETLAEDELQAQFEQYKTVAAGEGEMGFGYRFPDRVKLQYVVASTQQLQLQVDVSIDEIKSYWKANKQKYQKTVFEAAPQPASAPGTTQPAPKSVPKRVQKRFTEARADVERELRKNKARKRARQVMTKLADEAARPWHDLRNDAETRYKPIPPGVEQADYLKAASDRIAARFGVVLEYGETDFVSRDTLRTHPALSGASTPDEGDEPLSLADYAFRVPEFYPIDRSRETALRLQRFQTPPIPLTVAGRGVPKFVDGGFTLVPGEPDKFILFRVIDTRESAVPENLAEVREQVERDVRLIHAFERIEPIAKEFYAAALRLGVEQAFPLFEDVWKDRGVRSVSKPAAFARRTRLSPPQALRAALEAGEPVLEPSSIPGVGRSEALIDACFAMTEEGWTAPTVELPQTDRIRRATTRPAVEPAPKVQLVSIPKLRKRFVIELVTSTPVDAQEYERQYRRGTYFTLRGDRATVLASHWFDPKHIERRCGFEDLINKPLRESEEGIASPQAPPPPIPF